MGALLPLCKKKSFCNNGIVRVAIPFALRLVPHVSAVRFTKGYLERAGFNILLNWRFLVSGLTKVQG